MVHQMERKVQENIDELIEAGRFCDPHHFLGLQRGSIRLWRPDLDQCFLEVCGKTCEAKKVDPAGLFECSVGGEVQHFDYRVPLPSGQMSYDPYSFEQVLGELDVHLLIKGLHYELYDLLGATCKVHQGVKGVNFAVWAPGLKAVFLMGDFNGWNEKLHPMRQVGATGVFELFIPGLKEGERYKFALLTEDGECLVKTDPVGHAAEVRPKNASVVFDVSRYQWNDQDWLKKRKASQKGAYPLNVYEVHLGSWIKEKGTFLNYRELARHLATYCSEMHFTHVELMGICEHPLDESWGYQVTGYFAPTSRFGTPEEFQFLVDHLHQEGIGVLIDWVPAHFPTDPHSLCRFNGTYLYEHKDPRQGYHPHWNTHIFNYGRYEVSNFLIASALFWLEKMHVDGLRVDAVASMLYLDYGREPGKWVPNHKGDNLNLEAIEFLKHLNGMVKKLHPDVLMIAEESSLFPGVTKKVEEGGLGFDLKWSLGWMNDTLRLFSQSFEERDLSLLRHIPEYIFSEAFHLVLSHDEVVHEKGSLLGKMPGTVREQFAGVRLLLSFMICFPGKKLLFMGGEFGMPNEWDCCSSLPWKLLDQKPHDQLHEMCKALNRFYREEEVFWEERQESFELLELEESPGCVFGYFRKNREKKFLCLHNFFNTPATGYPVPLLGGAAEEEFNTDRAEWGGHGILNRQIETTGEGILVDLPPLATVILRISRHE